MVRMLKKGAKGKEARRSGKMPKGSAMLSPRSRRIDLPTMSHRRRDLRSGVPGRSGVALRCAGSFFGSCDGLAITDVLATG